MAEMQDVLVAAFPNEEGGKQALHRLQDARKAGFIDFKDAAVLMRDAQSHKLQISETADKGFGKGAAIGGVAGAAVGILAGPVGWATLGGAAVGGLAAKLKDGGFKDERLRQIGEKIPPGSSAMVAVVDHPRLQEVEKMLKEAGAEVATEMVGEEVARQLDEEAMKHQSS